MNEHRGTSRSYTLLRLSRDAPALYAEVVAGTLSPHAAMVKAGLRPVTFTVRVVDAQGVARVLRKHLPPDMVAEVAELLTLAA